MKKRLFVLTLIILSFNNLYSQGLDAARVAKIKSATAKILIEGSNASGTGFFIANNGTLITCWHVINPAVIRSPQTNEIVGFKKIFVQLHSKQILEFGVPTKFLQKAYNDGITYDFCPLIPVKPAGNNYPFLKLGSFSIVNEGDEIYTSGFPLGINEQFVSKGIISTKYTDTINLTLPNGIVEKKSRSQALMDITMNRGNSGGAIVKIGRTIDDDQVVGFADFIINPIGGKAESLIKMLNSASGSVLIQGVDPNATFSLLTEVVANTSIGVSGCVSIDHVLQSLEKLRQ